MDITSGIEVSLRIPQGWQERSQLIVISQSGDNFRPNLVVVKEEQKGRTIDQFLADHLQTLTDTFEGFEVIEAGPVAFGPHQGNFIEYTFESNDTVYQQGQFFLTMADVIYTFTYSDLASHFEVTRRVVREVISQAVVRRR